jgi:hypothetical protein
VGRWNCRNPLGTSNRTLFYFNGPPGIPHVGWPFIVKISWTFLFLIACLQEVIKNNICLAYWRHKKTTHAFPDVHRKIVHWERRWVGGCYFSTICYLHYHLHCLSLSPQRLVQLVWYCFLIPNWIHRMVRWAIAGLRWNCSCICWSYVWSSYSWCSTWQTFNIGRLR